MKKNSLARFTTEQLQVELVRRQSEPYVNPLSDYYFFDTLERREVNFWVVHKRHWHLEHSVDSRHVESEIGDYLPKGFAEIQESCFEYALRQNAGKSHLREEAIGKLKDAGMTYLDKPYFEALVTHMVKFGERSRSYRHSIYCDTPAIKRLIEGWAKKIEALPSPSAYRQMVVHMGELNNHHVEFYNEYGGLDGGCYVSIMDQAVWESLPPAPAEDD